MSSVKTAQYIRKPLYVDAVRVTGANFDEVADWCQGEIQTEGADHIQAPGKRFIRVRVHNPKNPRQTKAFIGDWLLYTERGYKVYTNKAFHESFDEAINSPNGSGELVFGSEEISGGISLNEAIDMLKDGRLQFVPVVQREVEAQEAV